MWKQKPQERAKHLEQEMEWNAEIIEEFADDGLWISESMARGLEGSLVRGILSQIRNIWSLKRLGIEIMVHTWKLRLVEVTGVNRNVRHVRISPVGPLVECGLLVPIRATFWGLSLGHTVLVKLAERSLGKYLRQEHLTLPGSLNIFCGPCQAWSKGFIMIFQQR